MNIVAVIVKNILKDNMNSHKGGAMYFGLQALGSSDDTKSRQCPKRSKRSTVVRFGRKRIQL